MKKIVCSRGVCKKNVDKNGIDTVVHNILCRQFAQVALSHLERGRVGSSYCEYHTDVSYCHCPQ